MGSLSSLTPEPVPLDLCHTCGHLRSSHRDHQLPVCWASVSTSPDHESCYREPCSCREYVPDDGLRPLGPGWQARDVNRDHGSRVRGGGIGPRDPTASLRAQAAYAVQVSGGP